MKERYRAIEEAQRIAQENMNQQQTNPEAAKKPASTAPAEPIGQMEEVDISLFT